MSQVQRLGLFCALVVLYHPALKVYSSKSYDLEQFVLLPLPLPLIVYEVLLRDQNTGQILTASDKEHFKYKPSTCLSYLKSFTELPGWKASFKIYPAN